MHESLRSSPDSSQSSIEAPGFKYSHYPFPFPSNKMEPWLPPSSLALSMSHADSWGCVTVPLMAFLVLTSQSSDSLISNDLHLYFTSAVHTHATPNRSVPLSAFQTPLASFGSRLLLQPLFLYFSRSFFLPLSFPGLPLFSSVKRWGRDEAGQSLHRYPSIPQWLCSPHISLCTLFFGIFQTRFFLCCSPPATLKSTEHC